MVVGELVRQRRLAVGVERGWGALGGAEHDRLAQVANRAQGAALGVGDLVAELALSVELGAALVEGQHQPE